MCFCNPVDHGSWFDFTRSWWNMRQHDNVYIVFYEDMKRVSLKGECLCMGDEILFGSI